jgi:hypothetical protein
MVVFCCITDIYVSKYIILNFLYECVLNILIKTCKGLFGLITIVVAHKTIFMSITLTQ